MIHDTAEQWVQAFLEQPDLRLDELLCRYDQVAPYFGAEPSDVLVRIVRPRNDAALKTRVDQALADWLDLRMREREPVPDEDRNGYVQDILQALWAVLRLQARTAGDLLAERFEEVTAWAEAVSPRDFYDLRAQLWLTLAHVQPNRRLLSFWYGLCDQVGLGLLDERYLDIALIALRVLPQTEGDVQPGPEVLRGLARWARHQPDRTEHRERFVAEWRVLVALYPRGPDFWHEQVTPLLEGNRGKPFVRWWAEVVGMAPQGARTTAWRPGQDETKKVVTRARQLSGQALAAEVERFARLHEAFADTVGSAQDLVRAFNVLGNALLNRRETNPVTRREHARLALRLAGAAVSRARNDEPSWALWAQALERLGHRDLAETVLWEAAREFPDDPHTRCDLAALLIDQGRSAEAEALYRDTITRFPDNDVSRNALARLLADHDQAEAAERLYRDTMKDFPGSDVCRNDLARLLKQHGRTAAAEALYRQTMERFPADAGSRLDLGLMLLDLGRLAEVEPLLETLRGLRDKEAQTLAAHLDAVKQGRPRPHRTEPTIPPAVLPPDEATAWSDMRRSAEAMRAGFRLSKALDRPGLLLVTPEMRQQLRAEAEATLAALMKTHPHHPVVRLVARRYGGKTAAAAGIVPAKDDYALRLELARTGNSDYFPGLLTRFEDHRPITALAWLLIDEQSTDAAAELLRWLPTDPDKITDPILLALHTRLHAIIGRRLSGMTVNDFLDIWCEEWVGPAESLNAVLDLAVLGLVARDPPYAALAWVPEPEPEMAA